MKALLGLILLVVSVHSAALIKRSFGTTSLPTFNVTEGSGIRHRRYADKPDLSAINQMRRAVASAGGIGNMKDLEWDERLAAEARNMPSDCDKVEHGQNYRVFMEGPNDNAMKMVTFYYTVLLALDQVDNIPLTAEHRREMKSFKKHLEDNQDKYSLMIFELFNPAQTKIGCAQSRCHGVLPGEADLLAKLLGMSDLTYSFEIMCAIGPHRSWSTAELQKVEYAARDAGVNNTRSFAESSGSSYTYEKIRENPSEQYNKPITSAPFHPSPPMAPATTESSGSSTGFQLVLILSLLSFLM